MFIRKTEEGYVVEMSATEHEKAMTYGTEEYRALREIRSDYPGIEVMAVKTMKPTKVKDKLNMKTIKAYVKANGTDDQKAAFAKIALPHFTEEGEYIEALSFFEITKWFRAEFPEYIGSRENHLAEVEKIFDEVERKIEASRKEREEKKRAELKAEVEEFLAA